MENNKLIAEFMGADSLYMVVDVDKQRGDFVLSTGLLLENTDGDKSHFDDRFNIDSSIMTDIPNYHSSWNELMPVVEKINNITIKGNACRVTMRSNATLIEKVGEKDWEAGPIVTGKGMLKNTYKAVIKFIKWYNENVKDDDMDTRQCTKLEE